MIGRRRPARHAPSARGRPRPARSRRLFLLAVSLYCVFSIPLERRSNQRIMALVVHARIAKWRQVSRTFRPCSSYHLSHCNLCRARFDISTTRTLLILCGSARPNTLIPARTQVYGIYLNEITPSTGQAGVFLSYAPAVADSGGPTSMSDPTSDISNVMSALTGCPVS